MARGLRDLRRKMKAIRSTRQVTKAMELVAASKMRRAVQNAVMLRRYAKTAFTILERVAQRHPELHPYLSPRPPRRILALLFTSDRGLCGSLNTQLFRTVLRYIEGLKSMPSFASIEFIAVGKKGQQFLARNGQKVIAAFPALSTRPTFRDTLPIVRLSTESFLSNTCDCVTLLYPDFITALVQDPIVRVLLPLSESDLKAMLGSLIQNRRVTAPEEPSSIHEYLFEPSPQAILETVLPQLTQLQVYQAVLETSASEHSARMVAMKNASDSASDLLEDLTLTYNQTRQAGITSELSELSASKASLE